MAEMIRPNQLRARQEMGEGPLVLDVRSPEEFAAGHVPGAMNIPGDELPAHLETLPRSRPIIVYCNMQHPGDSRSERATMLLRRAGLDATTMAGGFPAWREAGYPVEKATTTSNSREG